LKNGGLQRRLLPNGCRALRLCLCDCTWLLLRGSWGTAEPELSNCNRANSRATATGPTVNPFFLLGTHALSNSNIINTAQLTAAARGACAVNPFFQLGTYALNLSNWNTVNTAQLRLRSESSIFSWEPMLSRVPLSISENSRELRCGLWQYIIDVANAAGCIFTTPILNSFKIFFFWEKSPHLPIRSYFIPPFSS